VLSAIAHIAAAVMFMSSDSLPLGVMLIVLDVSLLGAAAMALEDH
jgi:hypothetical protein